jgi:hypothetical protein
MIAYGHTYIALLNRLWGYNLTKMPHALDVCRYIQFSREIIISIDPQTIPKISLTPTPFSDETTFIFTYFDTEDLAFVFEKQSG